MEKTLYHVITGYKQHNMVKLLIDLMPNVTVNLIWHHCVVSVHRAGISP